MLFTAKKNKLLAHFIVPLTYSLLSVSLLSESKNIISKGHQLKDGEFLTSVDELFELGFFNASNSSTLRYFGIRYRSIRGKAIVWMANRDSAISDTGGSFTIEEDGNGVVRDRNGSVIWSTNAYEIGSNETVGVLLTTGNFILSANTSSDDVDKAYWQSFNYPTDTILPGMTVRSVSPSILYSGYSSWLSETDPSTGNFTIGVYSSEVLQIAILEQTRIIWRSGYWTGSTIAGYQVQLMVYNDGSSARISYNSTKPSDLLRFQLSWDGYLGQSRWNESENKWSLMQRRPANECDKYNYCGNFGVCSYTNRPLCDCIDGFFPRNVEKWSSGDRSGGCWRSTPLQCQNRKAGSLTTLLNSTENEDEFKLLRNMKLPDSGERIGRGTQISLEECKARCLETCSCNAFAYVDGVDCMLWRSDLIDVQHFENSGFGLYVRLGSSEIGGSDRPKENVGGSRLSSRVIVIIVVACGVFALSSAWLLWKQKKKLKGMWIEESEVPLYNVNSTQHSGTGKADPTMDSSQVNVPDLPMFSFKTVAVATHNFSQENLLGRGGFGPVYKGNLPGGEKIAVKRLSKVSGQGLEEFKNEIILIAKLQHRNLVRLLGCCIQGEEKILLYEFMPNKSLDFFIFDPTMQALLDWPKRFAIIEGIARGLLYLHRDSRLRIIHRDLKASNVLLDDDMNPKISDFGMAKIFGGNQTEANTNRVVGTFGYMSPEYAMEGLFSVKSDVYSFGVLLLEIVSGRRNTSFRLPDHLNLIAYSWELWSEERAMELVDSSITNLCSEEVVKCIQIGILCVQDSALHRPTMQAVMSMLETNTSTLPLPEQPTFSVVRNFIDSDIHGDAPEILSSNDLTVTAVVGR